MYRQGDVITPAAQPLPATARRRASSLIAFGGVTGHAYRLCGGRAWAYGSHAFQKHERLPQSAPIGGASIVNAWQRGEITLSEAREELDRRENQ